MNRTSALGTAILFGLTALACGGGEQGEVQTSQAQGTQQPASQPAAQPASGGDVSNPDWFEYDEASNTVTMEITAGLTSDNNAWNFNGFFGGEGEILVPEGATVTINFVNDDPNMAHSIGVDERTSNFPASFGSPTPAFEGGISSNPTSMTESTMPGESETITFTAESAGEYSLVCYVPGHAAVGMYVFLTVTTDGTAGVRE